ncbi:YfiM family lipoprotein [Xenorhabdus sp. XENO-1]|uniref:YfiM family lipoprotein n=1 Tax=Xenorhabdus bovienii TaxID=40576 RepID=UPI0020CA5167|nr:YfiM family lipoprotein [Xenorhabdus bovienii]MCP9268596.1 YfiM family lipoprotein [Xenorhabdus bovienii subsp. africana]
MIKPVINIIKNVLVISPLLFTTACSNMYQANDNWTGKDKAQHFLFSAAMAAAGNAYGERQNWTHRESAQFGLLLSISFGAAKEFYDSRPPGTGWSWRDFVYDVAGAMAGYSLYQSLK